MIAELSVRPDRIEAFLVYTIQNLPISRCYAGNIAFDILVNPAEPDSVFFYEVWESAAAQQAYMAWCV